jgi:hypothetical protein
VLLLVGLWFVLDGLVWLLAPAAAAGLAGIELHTARATTEIRATYGGVGVGFGGFLLYAAWRPALSIAGLVGALGLCAGIAGSRLVGVLVDGNADGFTVGSLAIELCGVGLVATVLRRRRSAARDGSG